MKCFCGTFYIGKTKQPLFCRIRDHVSLIAKYKMETPISRHVGLCHNFNLNSICFFSLEHIPHHERGGDIDRKLLQLETRWIYLLQATRHPGLNEGISYKPFLQTWMRDDGLVSGSPLCPPLLSFNLGHSPSVVVFSPLHCHRRYIWCHYCYTEVRTYLLVLRVYF